MRLFVVDDRALGDQFSLRETMTFNPHITSQQRARIAAGLRTCIGGEGGVSGQATRKTGSMPAGAGRTT
jgi:hypothetical protein